MPAEPEATPHSTLGHGYTLKKDDLVQGQAWLQGHWKRPATPRDRKRWHAAAHH
jgi:hypothetical protein